MYQLTPVVQARSLLPKIFAERGPLSGGPESSALAKRSCSKRVAISTAPIPDVGNGWRGFTPPSEDSPVRTQALVRYQPRDSLSGRSVPRILWSLLSSPTWRHSLLIVNGPGCQRNSVPILIRRLFTYT